MFSPAAGELVGDVTFIERFKKVNVVVCSREQDFTIRKHPRFFLTTLTPKIVGGLDPVQFLLFEKITDLVGSRNRCLLHQMRLRNFVRDPEDCKQVVLQFNRVSLAVLVGSTNFRRYSLRLVLTVVWRFPVNFFCLLVTFRAIKFLARVKTKRDELINNKKIILTTSNSISSISMFVKTNFKFCFYCFDEAANQRQLLHLQIRSYFLYKAN